jgi:vacuolar protein sorting-associated protein IST1
MIIQAKLTQTRNKKVMEIERKRNEIKELLKEKGIELAKAKMETILQLEDMITVYDILGTLFEKIKEKCSYLLYYDKCPEDLRASLDTIIYASCRIEMPEIQTLREHFKQKYGENYIYEASSNRSQLVNINVVEKLRMKVPQEQIIISRLRMLCQEFKIDYVFPQDIIQINNNMFEGFNNNQFQNQQQYVSVNDKDPIQYSQLNFNQNQPFSSMPGLINYGQSHFGQYNPNQTFMQNSNITFGGNNEHTNYPNPSSNQIYDSHLNNIKSEFNLPSLKTINYDKNAELKNEKGSESNKSTPYESNSQSKTPDTSIEKKDDNFKNTPQ